MKRKVLYAGSFDPITLGHVDVIQRALNLFDEVVVAVAKNTEKSPLFTVQERVGFIQEVFKKDRRVKVVNFDGLVVEFAKKQGLNCLLRGLRATSDFEYEFQMALTNRVLSKLKIETVFLTPSQEFFYLSSKLVKQLASLKADIRKLVPRPVERALRRKFFS